VQMHKCDDQENNESNYENVSIKYIMY
jgi:hypothetical protein